jgi:preprotein translocase subunit SecA
MNYQREAIYKRRRNALFGDRVSLDIANMFYDVAAELVTNAENNYDEFEIRTLSTFGIEPPMSREAFAKMKASQKNQALYLAAEKHYQEKSKEVREKMVMPILSQVKNDRSALLDEPFLAIVGDGQKGMGIYCDIRKAIESDGRELIKEMEKSINLNIIDQEWKEHLRDMDDLKQSVQNASYEQKDPLLIYKFESVELFQNFLKKVNYDAVTFLMKAGVQELRFQQAQPVRQAEPKLSTNKKEEDAPRQAPILNQKIADRNQRVNVQYKDGTVKKDVKYKTVEDDIMRGKAVLVQ